MIRLAVLLLALASCDGPLPEFVPFQCDELGMTEPMGEPTLDRQTMANSANISLSSFRRRAANGEPIRPELLIKAQGCA